MSVWCSDYSQDTVGRSEKDAFLHYKQRSRMSHHSVYTNGTLPTPLSTLFSRECLKIENHRQRSAGIRYWWFETNWSTKLTLFSVLSSEKCWEAIGIERDSNPLTFSSLFIGGNHEMSVWEWIPRETMSHSMRESTVRDSRRWSSSVGEGGSKLNRDYTLSGD